MTSRLPAGTPDVVEGDPQPRQARTPAEDRAASELFHGLLRRMHLGSPSDLPRIVAEQGEELGARDVTLHVIDLEQQLLVPLARSADGTPEVLSVSGTVAGRAFATTTILRTTTDEPGLQRLWLPLLDGTERIGVMGLSLPEERLTDALVATCERYAHLVALIAVTKSQYGDDLRVVRRRQPMTIASELLWGLTPPLTFAADRLVLAGMLEPCYDCGGDALDYALDDRTLHLAVFDATGHGLEAAGASAFTLAAYRQSRRAGRGLLETYAAMDDAIARQSTDDRFVTALIAELDLDSGQLRWVSAGHPPPLVIRDARRARILEATPAPPLGVGRAAVPPTMAGESLEPGDLLLLYTDGLTEARDPEGRLFSIDGLSEFIEREAGSGQTTPETLRRLRQAIVGSPRAELRDDATALLLEWRRGGDEAFMPQTVV